jgi:oxygen-independent coproporphyrinogen-3 oxidase
MLARQRCALLAAMNAVVPDLDRASQLDRPVPRYTSYPTAPHFHRDIQNADYRRWLGAIDPGGAVSLYIHIPYCHELCWYCGCNTRATRRAAPVADYARRLATEIGRVADLLPARMRASHIHWGGGTPTILGAAGFLALHGLLARRFDIGTSTEIAIEVDPRNLEQAMIPAMAQAGVSRVSLGVQDFDPRVQRAINRWQPFEMTKRAVDDLRTAGIGAINFDLIYGLPYQTTESLLESVDRSIGLAPQRIALFGYAHVPWMKPHQRLIAQESLPGSEARWAQANAAAGRLEAAGYRRIGLDHFALPEDELSRAAGKGELHRNFQGYTTDTAGTLIGFGASAIGALPQGYVQNNADVRLWSQAIDSGDLAIARGIELDADDRLRRHVIERLMCDLAVDLAEAAVRFGFEATYLSAERTALEDLAQDGQLALEGMRVAVTPAGRPLMRLAAAVFDRYLDRGTGRHSQAV